ncbi:MULTISPECIES: HIT family protein [Micrococcaceae]|uniref:Diadenosine tetraphosphate hydrolase n=1 Tax=Pseudoglutamicibacter albus DNF00011 TaxID=1401063 RepID=A0A095YH44_9MICC|nr:MULTISPECIES: HIT family protein [Micrococcaceae]MCG7305236.1 HIT family protein [Pseudoglutamicibacter albus]KGF21360.1 diadenosine tetraphosphate hydrolase [Pseudoglutamicibacter albus DNF00011]KGF21456.1 diadenosine tetraphosphate hydrolase [Pseudoglutamicibacter albus DNF00011]OFT24068.1 diadenosine tetraphosphate hydrolase [Arthrobacter sp. HMSC08H08]OFT43177.1 diadenosine tetraphosphate hydrolase [Arthrobacter sp. HMSC06H05]
MATLFTRIINGELPGRFVWSDETCVAFLSIGPITQGHTLVVPREEVDKWTDASPELIAHLSTVAQTIGQAQLKAFGAERAGLMIAGFEVDHLHVHVWPTNSLEDYSLDNVQNDVADEVFDEAQRKILDALKAAGHEANLPQ